MSYAQARLANSYLFVSPPPFSDSNTPSSLINAGVWNHFPAGTPPIYTSISVNQTGRYVRVQLAGTNYLSLAEVEVLSNANRYPIDPDATACGAGSEDSSGNITWPGQPSVGNVNPRSGKFATSVLDLYVSAASGALN